MLGRCVADDSKLQEEVIRLLRGSDNDSRTLRSNSITSVVVEAGLALCHEKDRKTARIHEFTELTNAIMVGRGEVIELEARAVGEYLRSIGFFSQRLGRAGRGLYLTSDIRRRFHELAFRFDVRSIEKRNDRCGFCTEARACFGQAEG
jgi:hypothetical protein